MRVVEALTYCAVVEEFTQCAVVCVVEALTWCTVGTSRRAGARGVFVATVSGSNTSQDTAVAGQGTHAAAVQSVRVRARARDSVLLIGFKGSPLRVECHVTNSTFCQGTDLCIQSVAPTCPARVAMSACVTDLSTLGTLDWARPF